MQCNGRLNTYLSNKQIIFKLLTLILHLGSCAKALYTSTIDNIIKAE